MAGITGGDSSSGLTNTGATSSTNSDGLAGNSAASNNIMSMGQGMAPTSQQTQSADQTQMSLGGILNALIGSIAQ